LGNLRTSLHQVRTSPAETRTKECPAYNNTSPGNISANDITISFLGEKNLKILPNINRIITIPATKVERPYKALLCDTEI